MSWVLGDSQVWVKGPHEGLEQGLAQLGGSCEDPKLSLLCSLPRAEAFAHLQPSAARLTELKTNTKRKPFQKSHCPRCRLAPALALVSVRGEALQERAWLGTGGNI